jgi:tape measure domain-containing protein
VPDVASLQVVVSANTTQAEQGLSALGTKVSGFGQAMQSVMAGIGAGIGMQAFSAITSGIEAAAGAAIGFNSNLEQSTIAFTSMLGSAEAAQGFLAEMKTFAATTPFEFPDLLKASKQMMAFGFEAKEVKPLLTAVGSAAAAMGTGRSGVDSITKALGQMRAATVVQAGELNQLTEQGVPAYEILADAMGITTGQVKKLASEGKIASDVFIDAFQVWAQANYGDMMAKQALTFEGAISTIKDSLQFAIADAFRPFFEVISAGAVQLAQFLQGDTFAAWATATAETLRAAFQVIADSFRTVQQVFGEGWEPGAAIHPFTNAVGMLALAFRDQLLPALQVVVGIIQTTLVPAFAAVGAFIAAHPELVMGLAAAWATFAIVSTVAGWIMGLGAAFSAVSGAITAAGGVIGAIVAVLGGPLTVAILAVAAVIGVLAAAWIGNWGGIQEKTQAVIEWLGPYIQAALDGMVAFWQTHGTTIITILENVWTIISQGAQNAFTVIGALITAAGQIWNGEWSAAWTTLTTAAATIWDGWAVQLGAALAILQALFEPVWTSITTTVQGALDAIGAAIQGAWDGFLATIQGVLDQIVAAVTAVWTQIPEDIRADLVLIATHIATHGDEWVAGMVTAGAGMLTAITTSLAEMVAGVTAWAGQFLAPITALVGTASAAATSVGTGMYAAITGELNRIVSAVSSWAGQLVSAVRGLVGQMSSAGAEVGRAISSGIASGVSAGAGAIRSAAMSAARAALPAAKSALGIKSPSKVFALEVGKPAVEGIIAGVEAMTQPLEQTMRALVTPPAVPRSGPYSGAGAGAGSGIVVNVNVYGSALASRSEIADAVVVGIATAQRQGRTRLTVV